jgi:hypothetical protein
MLPAGDNIVNDPGDGILKPQFKVAWQIGAVLSVVLLAIIANQIYATSEACRLAPTHASPACDLPMRTKLLYAAWTAAVPIYFAAEWVYGINWDIAQAPDNKARLDYVKACQDQARTIWAGLALAIGVLLLKIGG